MDNSSPEKLRPSITTERERKAPSHKPETVKEVHKKTSEVMKQGEAAESAEGMAGVESFEGKVSEVAGENKSFAPTAGFGKNYSADEIEAIRAKLLAALPPQEVMIKQIRRKLYAQEKVLTKRMKKLKKKAHKHAFQLTIVVMQLRKLREYFSMLVHATYEIIKHLWLKIVHGV